MFWGQVRLLEQDDWDAAGHAYAEEHDRYFDVTLTAERWFDEVLYRLGPEADAVRERVLPLWVEDVTRVPDVFFSGPDVELTEDVRKRMFGEGK